MSGNGLLESQTAVVVGGSSGFGRGVVRALARRKARVVAVARDPGRLRALAEETGAVQEVADFSDAGAAGRLLQEYRPNLLVLCAGVSPLLRPIHLHTWETFAEAWEVDTKGTFVWLRDALLLPLSPGSHVIATSSAAALNGSPLSGAYAGAKRTNWFLAEYAAAEAARLELGIRIHCLIPTLSPETRIGRAATEAYADRAGVDIDSYLRKVGPASTPEAFGDAVLHLYESPEKWPRVAYRLSGDGLSEIAQS